MNLPHRLAARIDFTKTLLPDERIAVGEPLNVISALAGLAPDDLAGRIVFGGQSPAGNENERVAVLKTLRRVRPENSAEAPNFLACGVDLDHFVSIMQAQQGVAVLESCGAGGAARFVFPSHGTVGADFKCSSRGMAGDQEVPVFQNLYIIRTAWQFIDLFLLPARVEFRDGTVAIARNEPASVRQPGALPLLAVAMLVNRRRRRRRPAH